MTIDEVKKLLKHYSIYPRKEQGQNFLLDDSVIEASIKAAGVSTEDTVLEIGPGFGALTNALSEHAGTVVAVEQARVLAAGLKKQQQFLPNVTIINGDVRTVDLHAAGLHDLQYKLVANLPYSITSWIIRHFLEHEPRPSSLTVLVQKEVAERMAAQPGKTSVLSIATQIYTEPTVIKIVKPESFYPAPKVDSAIIHLQRREQLLTPEPEALMRLVNIGFAAKRKQLHNNLATGLHKTSDEIKQILERADISPTARPQELSIEQWETLRQQLAS
jgi:16S rRNA (adenine1518-N6/adenine1519-N6)-dimethyltransferase